jgi:hypothetical protein
MKISASYSWIATTGMIAFTFILTVGTESSPEAPSLKTGEWASGTFTNQYARGMQPVTLHNLKETRLLGIRTRIELPGDDNFLTDMKNPAAVGNTMPMMQIPVMQLPDAGAGQSAGRFDGLDGLDADNAVEADGLSWGWLADDVGAIEPPTATPEQDPGGFGFSSSGGARLYDRSDSRLGTSQGFGDGGNDAFIFQRRRNNGF